MAVERALSVSSESRATGAVLLRLADPPPHSARPSTTFLVLVALLLGVPAAVGGAFIALVMLALGAAGALLWLLLMRATRRQNLLLALCENGCLLWSRQNPNEFVPWTELRSLALVTVRSRSWSTGPSLRFDLGRVVSVVPKREELLAAIGQVVQRGGLQEVKLRSIENRFPFGVSQAWARDEAALEPRLSFLFERVVVAATLLFALGCLISVLFFALLHH